MIDLHSVPVPDREKPEADLSTEAKLIETMKQGKTLREALALTNKAVMEALDGLPPVKVHCSLLAEEAIHAAVEDYLKNHPEEAEKLK